MKRSLRRNLILSLTVGIPALLLRIWNTFSIGTDYYANFLSDASTYRLWSSRIAAGIPQSEPIFPMGPLYPYFLALNLKLGISYYSVLFLQAAMGASAAVMIGLTARRIWGATQGYIAGLMAAFYAPFIFYDGLLLSESPQIWLLTLGLFLVIPEKKGSIRLHRWGIAGFLIGLTALGRGTILIFPVLLALYWSRRYFVEKGGRRNELFKRGAFLWIGILTGIFPAAAHNIANGDFVPISSNFGINFFIGNNAKATGVYDEPQGLNLSSDFTGRKIAERESGRSLRSSEVSSFWKDKTIDYIKGNPGSFIGGIIKKCWLYLWYFDIPQAESIQIQKMFSPAFRIPLIGFGFLLVSGMAGLYFAKKDENYRILLFLLFSSILGAVVFFVIGRFRLLGAIPLLLLSGYGLPMVYQAIRDGTWRIRATTMGIIIGSIIVIYLPRPIDPKAKTASALDNVGIYHYYKNEIDKAITWYRLSLDEDPAHAGALNNIGAYFYASGQVDSTLYYFRRAAQADPLSDKTFMNMGRIFRDMGMLDSAYHYYEKAISAAPYGIDADEAMRELDMMRSDSAGKAGSGGPQSFDILFGMAERLSAGRKYSEAEKYYGQALQLKPDDIKALNNLGFTFQAQQKYEQASAMFERVLELSEANAIVYNNLAGAVYRMGLIDSSIVLWEKALRLDPGNPSIKKNLEYIKRTRPR